ncbi:MAG: tRNA (adenosine(37)-N6)-threonylcarbamoyltransferase complex transferase subunit TsaD [Bacteroidetes bacterium]|nr:tRNA (adenosine(37)-N6)-threonylcarbamoyltransferase complex transferase subunit TsaD [Bacteroidota bacterium]
MKKHKSSNLYILAIESSCDDTSCAILENKKVLSNVAATQLIHNKYGGVVPELASRDHEKNITKVVNEALQLAQVPLCNINLLAVTQGPGLMGSLLVGCSFAKSLSIALNIPIVTINHMRAHVMAHLIESDAQKTPPFPFLCLTVSGGHTQIIKVNSPYNFELLGQTIDDAVGEAFDKGAKILGLPYPGGPEIDRLAKNGNTKKYKFSISNLNNLDFSFSGIKTSLLYFIQKQQAIDCNFITNNLNDLCASFQENLLEQLLLKIEQVVKTQNIKHVAIAGGVSANSRLRILLSDFGKKNNVEVYLPKFEYCTDNAAMIGICAYFDALTQNYANLNFAPKARFELF